MKFELREPKPGEEFEKYYDLRWRILRAPWTQERIERGESEEKAIHLTAWCGDQLAGAGRLEFLSPDEARVRGMAVEHGFERQGVGSLVLKGLEERAVRMGAKRIVLHGRESAVEFYKKNGYEVEERSYTLYNSVGHFRMCKEL